MPVEIRETSVTPSANSDVVRLRISDADDQSALFELTIVAELPPYRVPTLVHLQREAIKIASFCREIQVSTEKRGFVRFFSAFFVDMYVCRMAHV